MPFLKTKFYPVNYDRKEIINMPFDRERNVFIMFRHYGFTGVRGHRLNEHACYLAFTVKPADFEITGEKV